MITRSVPVLNILQYSVFRYMFKQPVAHWCKRDIILMAVGREIPIAPLVIRESLSSKKREIKKILEAASQTDNFKQQSKI